MPDIRALIREVLAEEIAALRAELQPGPRTERIAIADARDLTGFALSILRRADDPAFAEALRGGRLRFAPDLPAMSAGHAAQAAPAQPPPLPVRPPAVAAPAPVPVSVQGPVVASNPAAIAELLKPLVCERDIAQVPEGQTRLRIGRRSRLTPLAGDEARRRGIRIERSAT